MRSRILVTVVLIVLVAGLTPPAGAQMALTHTFALRYWGARFDFGNPAPATFLYNQGGWGFSYRGDAQNQPWSLSFNYDRLNNTGQFWETSTLWNVNLHYRLGNVPNAKFSLFAGYGSVTQSNTTGGQGGTGSGLRLGADVRIDLQSQAMTGWYIAGEAAYGPSWKNNFAAFPSFANSSTSEWKIALGKEFPNGFAAQVGWRSFNWPIPTSPGCSTSPGCQSRWSGWTLELLMRR